MAIRGETLIRAIRMELGQDRGYGLSVPLSDAQIIYSIKTAISGYGRYHPKFSYQSFTAPLGQSDYTPNPKVRGIRQLGMIPVNTLFPITLPEMALIGGQFISWGTAIDYSIVEEYSIYLQWKQAADTVFSNTPSYTYLPDVNKLYFYNPASSVCVSFIGEMDWYTSQEEDLLWDEAFNNSATTDPNDQRPSVSHSEHLDEALSAIPPDHTINWLKKLALAESMKILGRMFSRYGIIPGVDGKDIQLNGPALLEEGKELWDATITEVREASFGMVPLIYR